jgi:3-oxoacyl-[acyl-carrier-protein] synthase II
MSEPIVVTGVGVVSPLGTGARAAWRAFAAGESGIRTLVEGDDRLERGVDPVPLPDAGSAGWVRGFRPREHIVSPQLRRMDWCSRMLVASVRQAFDDAGALPLAEQIRPRTGLVVGSCFGNQRETEVYLQRVLKSGPAAGQPLLFPNLVLNASAGYAAIELDVQGPNICVAEHEASGEAAVAMALGLLASGACDLVCAAGVDELSAILLSALSDRRLLHPDAMPPERRAAAMRAGRGLRGEVLPGEGAAALVLERAAHAAARGVAPYATLAAARIGATPAPAYGFAADADAAAARLLELADVPGPAVGGVIGGASGLARRDALDAAVLRALEQRGVERPGYAPFKRLVGDFGAAGALGAVLASLALDAGLLPGSPPAREPQRLLVVGAARGGALLPIVLDRFPGPRRCSSTASTSSSSC